MRILVQHHSRYSFPRPATLGPHVVRLRPASHTRARIETYGLRVGQSSQLHWQQDPSGNHIARLSFKKGDTFATFDLHVEMAVELRAINPFDFLLDDDAQNVPVGYPPALAAELSPYRSLTDPAFALGPKFDAFDAELPMTGTTLEVLTALNRAVHQRTRYVVRNEPGVWTPEQTLEEGRGSCRDSAVLMVALLRRRGIAARFVSGYLVQLTDEGMLPDEAKGVSHDVVDLHAWAEAFLPGAGWVGMDATSGLLCGEGHIPLACAATPSLAAPVEGTTDMPASDVSFELSVQRLGHEVRATAPFSDETYEALLTSIDHADALISAAGLQLTTGGEPTFNSREHVAAPEWNGEALGTTKWSQGLRLCAELRTRLMPNAAVLAGQGKHYPGEPLPRWTLDLIARADGAPVWTGDVGNTSKAARAEAKRFMEALAKKLGIADGVLAAFEDPWRHLQDEARLPVDVDPLAGELTDGNERQRLARVLDQGLGEATGYVLPLSCVRGAWRTDAWSFRRERLYLLQGDSPIGLRLPLASLPEAPAPEPQEEDVIPRDPRRPEKVERKEADALTAPLRTALCVEVRDDVLRVFLPPLSTAEDFLALVRTIDETRALLGLQLILEGYPPPKSPLLKRFAVTPDPGVLEVNLAPSTTGREHARLLETCFDAALHAGLHSEKYLLDGRMAGSGGGHHLTLGGPSALQSPLLQRPDILASLITLTQHHPSLSYLFTGLFVGPTSQAPRLDEARHDALYELEIALTHAFEAKRGELSPWATDSLFRHLLVDVSGNTHRAELCIDKLFDWRTPHGRQGLLELRAFEMPAHPKLAVAQALLVRALVAAVSHEPYRAPLVRWGTRLHDEFLLPHNLWRDFEEVLALLAERGVTLPPEAYRPFLELRCPVAGRVDCSGVTLEVRNALEPWNVLGEEASGAGTSRYVDSSVERVEVRLEGFTPERHALLVNGHAVPLRGTGRHGEAVAGVRFKAWAPPHSLHAHLPVDHPLRFDVVDTWSRRSLGACAYHVWHPEGQAFTAPPLTRFEAEARRGRRFTHTAPLPSPVTVPAASSTSEFPATFDLRRVRRAEASTSSSSSSSSSSVVNLKNRVTA